MKALSLTQPWATLVALGHKRYETRSWPTHHRGLLAIHAASRMPGYARDFAAEEVALGRVPRRLPVSQIVAVVNLLSCERTIDVAHRVSGLERHLGNFELGRWAWHLELLAAVETPPEIPCSGALGLWDLPAGVEQQLLDRLGPALVLGRPGVS